MSEERLTQIEQKLILLEHGQSQIKANLDIIMRHVTEQKLILLERSLMIGK